MIVAIVGLCEQIADVGDDSKFFFQFPFEAGLPVFPRVLFYRPETPKAQRFGRLGDVGQGVFYPPSR